MKLKQFFRHLALSVNPVKYRQVMDKTFAQTLGLYFFVWVIALLVLLIEGLLLGSRVIAQTNSIIDSTTSSTSVLLAPSLIIIPGIVLLAGILLFIASHVLTLLSALLIKLSVKKSLSFRDAWILCLHAVLVPFFLFTVLLPFTNQTFWLFVVFFFFYALFVVIGTSLVVGKNFKTIPENTTFK